MVGTSLDAQLIGKALSPYSQTRKVLLLVLLSGTLQSVFYTNNTLVVLGGSVMP
jgi:hypothetical protein